VSDSPEAPLSVRLVLLTTVLGAYLALGLAVLHAR
jgi:hypothetical protein